MPGLNLNAGAQVRVTGPTIGNGGPAPQTVTQAAFGPGFSQTGQPSTRSVLMPNDPFGLALWVGIAAVAGLLFIRYSLPA